MNDKQVLAALRHDLMTLPRAEHLVEDFKPRRRIGRATSTVRRRHGRLIGSRNSCAESGIEREYHHLHKVERERFAEREFREEIRDLDLHWAVEALSSREHRDFVDYLGRGMSEAQALAQVRADIAERAREELEESRREAALDFASYSEKDFYDYDLENGDFEDDLETAASYDDSYDPPTD